MSVMTWNVNSLRNAVGKMSEYELEKINSFDIIMLQETKMGRKAIHEVKGINWGDFDCYSVDYPHVSNGRGLGTNGVATLINKRFLAEPNFITNLLPGYEASEMEGRYLEIHYEKFIIINVYFPSASRNNDHRIPFKLKFTSAVFERVKELNEKGFLVTLGADFNIAQEKLDIHPRVIPLVSSGFRGEERDLMRKFTEILIDSWRINHPRQVGYTTWFHYDRKGNKGMRYDGILTSQNLEILDSHHMMDIGGSDHIPVAIHIVLSSKFRRMLKPKDFGSSEYLRRFYVNDTEKEENKDFKLKNHFTKNSKEKHAKLKQIELRGRIKQLLSVTKRPDYLPSHVRKWYQEDKELHEAYMCWSPEELAHDDTKEEQFNTHFYPVENEEHRKHFSEKLELKDSEILMGISDYNKTFPIEKEIELIIGHCQGEEAPINHALLQGYYDEMVESGYLRPSEDEYVNAKIHLARYAEVRKTKPKKVADKIRPKAELLPGGSDPDAWFQKKIQENDKRLTEENLKAIFAKTREKYPGFLTETELQYLENEIKPYDKAFSFDLFQKGKLKEDIIAPIKIHTVPHIPWNIRERPIPPAHFKKLIEFLKEKLATGIMEPSSGSYAAPWFVVAKKDGGIRFIQDLQLLNKVTIRDSGVVPNMADLTERASGFKIYSGVDCHSFYDQFVLDKESRDLTAIRTPLGLMRMTGLPQGWTNSVPNAQRVSSMIFHKTGVVEVFMDDVILFSGSSSSDEELESVIPGVRKFVYDHLIYFKEILQKCLDTGLTIHGTKNDLFVPEILCLGVVISIKGRQINPLKIDAIEKWKVPVNLTELRSFLGVCTVYRMWIIAFSVRAYYLFQLYKKNVRYNWGELQQNAFLDLKEAMSNAPIRRQINYDKIKEFPPILGVDAYTVGEGSMLGQEDESGTRFPVAFHSGLFNETERNYPQVKLEACALVRNLRRCYFYFEGVDYIVVEVDAWALKGMLNNPSVGDKTLLRWITYILTFPIELRTIKGKTNIIPDHLSRMYSSPPDESEIPDEMVEVENAIDIMIDYAKVSFMSKIFVINWELYEEDPSMGEILLFLENGTFEENATIADKRRIQKNAINYFIYEGFLFRQPDSENEVPRRVVCRNKDKNKVIKLAHEGIEGGHYQWERTYQKLRLRYYWKGMQKEVIDYCDGCVDCKFLSKKRYLEPAKFNKAPATIFMIWFGDLITLPLAVGKKRYIFHMECNLSAWPEAMSFQAKTTGPIMSWVKENVFMRLGLPMVLVVDGGEFAANEAKIVGAQLGFRIEVTAPYNHKAVGAIERAHSPLVGSLAKMCRKRKGTWPNKLNTALFAKRITTTYRGYTPYNIVFGQHPLFPLDFTVDSFAVINWKNRMTTIELLEARMKQIEEKFQIERNTKENLDRLRKKAVEYYNKVNEHRFRGPAQLIKVGDLVLLFDSTLDTVWGRKFDDRWSGPYKVIKIKEGTYLLAELNGTPLERPQSGDRLVLFPDLRKEFTDFNDLEHLEQEENENENEDENEDEDSQAYELLIKNATEELYEKFSHFIDNRSEEVQNSVRQIMGYHMYDSVTESQVFYSSQGTT